MDRPSLNIFLTALVLAWRFKSPSKKATKLIVPPMTGGTHPDFLNPCINSCRRTTRMCWASRDRVEILRQDPSNFVAAILCCPLHLCACGRRRAAAGTAAAPATAIPPKSQCRRQDPSNFVAVIPQSSSRTPRPRTPTPPGRPRLGPRAGKGDAKATETNKSCCS